jgi:very-short-patch-repair endonuclease
MDKAKLRQYARDLRKNSTDAEKHLWYNLRANRWCHLLFELPARARGRPELSMVSALIR